MWGVGTDVDSDENWEADERQQQQPGAEALVCCE